MIDVSFCPGTTAYFCAFSVTCAFSINAAQFPRVVSQPTYDYITVSLGDKPLAGTIAIYQSPPRQTKTLSACSP